MTETQNRLLLAHRMPERQLQENVRLTAKTLGVLYYHTHTSIHSPKGFPDVILLAPPVCLFRELKSQNGRLTDDQQAWLDGLAGCGFNVGLWRPIDWLAGRIQHQIAAMRNS